MKKSFKLHKSSFMKNVVKELSLNGSLNLRIVTYCSCTPEMVFQKGTRFSNSLKMISIGHIITFTKTRNTPKCVPRVCLVEVTFFDQFCFSFDKHRVKFLSQKSPKHIIPFVGGFSPKFQFSKPLKIVF